MRTFIPSVRSFLLPALVGASLASPSFAQCDGQWSGVGVPGISGNGSGAILGWDPDAAGPSPELLYVGGQYKLANDVIVNSFASWEPVFNAATPFGIWRDVAGGVRAGANPGQVNVLTPVGTQLIVGGAFSNAGAVAANNIARFDGPSNTWIPYHTGTSGPVYAAVIFNGQLMIGGRFRTASGRPCDSVARWDGSQWRPLGAGFQEPDPMNPPPLPQPTGEVRALVVYNNRLYAGGTASYSGVDDQGQPIDVPHFAYWDPNFGVWVPMLGQPLTPPPFRQAGIFTMKVYGNFLYAGGAFTDFGNSILRTSGPGVIFDVVGGVFSPPLNSVQVNTLSQVGTELLVGGDFLFAGGVVATRALSQNLVRFDGNRYWAVANQGTYGPVNAVTSMRNQVAVMGPIGSVGGQRVKNITWYDGAGWRRMGQGFDNPVFALTTYNDQLVAAGLFGRTDRSIQASGVASFNGEFWSQIGTGLQFQGDPLSLPQVYYLTRHQGDLIAVGEFTFSPPTTQLGNIAAWDGTSWQPRGFVDGPVYTAESYRDQLVIGGNLINYGQVAMYDGIGGYQALTFGTDAPVFVLKTIGAELFVGGGFQFAGGVGTGPIASWNYDTEVWSAYDPTRLFDGPNPNDRLDPPASCYAIEEIDGSIYIGGDWIRIGGVASRARFAKWNAVTRHWDAVGTGPGFDVYTIKKIAGRIIVGGQGGQNIAAWDGTTWRNVDGGTDGAVVALQEFENKLYAGGTFLLTSGQPSSYLSTFDPVFSVAITTQPAAVATCPGGSATFTVVVSGTGPITYQWRRNGVNIAGATSASLQLTNIAPAAAGNYSCVVSNGCSTATTANAALTLCPGDYNCDGSSDFFDYDDFVGDFESGAPRADFNQDGTIDFFDYGDFVFAYESGC